MTATAAGFKDWARISHDFEDNLITEIITAATIAAGDFCGGVIGSDIVDNEATTAAVYLIAAQMYKQRENTAAADDVRITGTAAAILSKYRKDYGV